MKPRLILHSVAVLAATTLFSLSSAQAGMGSCMFGTANGAPACANQPTTQPACPREDNAQGSSCVVSKAELGSMAAGGMQIAANVMRVLLDQANMVIGPNSGK